MGTPVDGLGPSRSSFPERPDNSGRLLFRRPFWRDTVCIGASLNFSRPVSVKTVPWRPGHRQKQCHGERFHCRTTPAALLILQI